MSIVLLTYYQLSTIISIRLTLFEARQFLDHPMFPALSQFPPQQEEVVYTMKIPKHIAYIAFAQLSFITAAVVIVNAARDTTSLLFTFMLVIAAGCSMFAGTAALVLLGNDEGSKDKDTANVPPSSA